MCMGVLPTLFICEPTCILYPWRPEKATNLLELVLLIVISDHTGAGSQTLILYRSTEYTHTLSPLSSPPMM